MRRDITLLPPRGLVPLVAIAAVLAGCSTAAPGGRVTTFESDFDGQTYVSMSPVAANETVSLAASWQSDMARDSVIVKALVKGAHDFKKKDSLRFTLGGTEVTLTGLPQTAVISAERSIRRGLGGPPDEDDYFSSKQYQVSRRFVEQLIQAETIPVKAMLQDDSPAEGTFENEGPSSLSQSLQRFLDKIDSVSAESIS